MSIDDGLKTQQKGVYGYSDVEFHNLQDAIVVSDCQISCAGSSDTLGHPKVYLQVDKEKGVRCPYCNQIFIYKKLSR